MALALGLQLPWPADQKISLLSTTNMHINIANMSGVYMCHMHSIYIHSKFSELHWWRTEWQLFRCFFWKESTMVWIIDRLNSNPFNHWSPHWHSVIAVNLPETANNCIQNITSFCLKKLLRTSHSRPPNTITGLAESSPSQGYDVTGPNQKKHGEETTLKYPPIT